MSFILLGPVLKYLMKLSPQSEGCFRVSNSSLCLILQKCQSSVVKASIAKQAWLHECSRSLEIPVVASRETTASLMLSMPTLLEFILHKLPCPMSAPLTAIRASIATSMTNFWSWLRHRQVPFERIAMHTFIQIHLLEGAGSSAAHPFGVLACSSKLPAASGWLSAYL